MCTFANVYPVCFSPHAGLCLRVSCLANESSVAAEFSPLCVNASCWSPFQSPDSVIASHPLLFAVTEWGQEVLPGLWGASSAANLPPTFSRKKKEAHWFP